MSINTESADREIDAQEINDQQTANASDVHIIRSASDSQLVQSAWGRLIDRNQATVQKAILARTRNVDMVDDLSQEIWIAVHRFLHQLEDPRKFSGWLAMIAIRLSINFVRRHKRMTSLNEKPSSGHGEYIDLLQSREPIPDEEVLLEEELGEIQAQTRNAISQLRPMDRYIIEQHYFKGLLLREIADQDDVPMGTVKRRLFTARKRFARIFEPLKEL